VINNYVIFLGQKSRLKTILKNTMYSFRFPW